MNKITYKNPFVVTVLLYIVLWTIIATLKSPSLDSYGDMIENYAWGQVWVWGTFKHPPFFAWVVKLWFMVFPTKTWAYFLLSYLNSILGAFGVIKIASLWLPDHLSKNTKNTFFYLVLLLTLCSFPYSNLASKFNADTILLCVWPWTAYAFFKCIDQGKKAWIWAIILGLMGAVSMLSKYYSGVLLLSLFLIALSNKIYLRWFLTLKPYIALTIMILLLWPHILWEIQLNFPFRQYMDDKFEGGLQFFKILSFVFSGFFYLIISWFIWIGFKIKYAKSNQPQIPLNATHIKNTQPLYLLAILPALITVLFHLIGGIHLTTHWAIPIWFIIPILLALNLLNIIPKTFNLSSFYARVIKYGVFLFIIGLFYIMGLSIFGSNKYYQARPQMAASIDTTFQKLFPNQTLSWIGGTWTEPGTIAFFGKDHPRALPFYPNEMPALVNPHPTLKTEYGAIICYSEVEYGIDGNDNKLCLDNSEKWLRKNHLPILKQQISYQATGWQFYKAIPQKIVVYWVPPTELNKE